MAITRNYHPHFHLVVADGIFSPEGADLSFHEAVLTLNDVADTQDAFYRWIPMNYFSEAFLASLLLRPQDWKIESLDESNVLFSTQPNIDGKIDPQDPTCPLRPVLIDLDETMLAAFIGKNTFDQIKALMVKRYGK